MVGDLFEEYYETFFLSVHDDWSERVGVRVFLVVAGNMFLIFWVEFGDCVHELQSKGVGL